MAGVDIAIVGGCGRVGLPLGLAFADRGLTVALFDRNGDAVASVNDGKMPFLEDGADDALVRVKPNLTATIDPSAVASAQTVIVVIGTPIDEHLDPRPTAVPDAIAGLREHLRDGQLLVLRSTLYPGVTAMVERLIASMGLDIDVAFCPERIVEGAALKELYDLPQIVAARTPAAQERAEKLFRWLTAVVVPLSPEEAELAKLFTNTWRYVKFAIANQLFMIANDFGLDFARIRDAMTLDYPRAGDLPTPGFAAGPCLLKDTMQLAAFNTNTFVLGHASMMVNEGLPMYVVSCMEQSLDLGDTTVGVLGMSFKAGSDDTRDSLAYKLRRILQFKAKRVLCTDPYVTTDKSLMPLDHVVRDADVLVIASPHPEYREIRTEKPMIDVWNLMGRGTRGMTEPRVSIVVTAYNEADAIVPCLDRILEAVTLPCEVLVVYDAPHDTTVEWVEKYARTEPRVIPTLNLHGPGPARAIRAGFDNASAPVVVVTMADGCDDPQQIDQLTRLVERGVVIAAASRYMRGGQQVGGPFLKAMLSRWAGRSLYLLARVGTNDATNSFKAYRRSFVHDVGIDSDGGFEVGVELVAKARRLRLPVVELPTIWLDRTFGVSNFKLMRWLPLYLRWYRFAFGPELTVEELRVRTGSKQVDGR